MRNLIFSLILFLAVPVYAGMAIDSIQQDAVRWGIINPPMSVQNQKLQAEAEMYRQIAHHYKTMAFIDNQTDCNQWGNDIQSIVLCRKQKLLHYRQWLQEHQKQQDPKKQDK